MSSNTIWASIGLATALVVGCGDDGARPTADAGTRDAEREDAGPPTCPAGSTPCDTRCIATASDPDNCGGCGITCLPSEACADGTCGVICPTTQIECGGRCVDTTSDRRHCGECGSECAEGEICVGGSCEISCPESQTVCGGRCVDTQSSPDHCGACDAACVEGQACNDGSCDTYCRTGLTDCGGACVDTQVHPAHCGACDAPCATDSGASGLCTAGTCRIACDPLLGDCNADLAASGGDGCETPLETDPANCGACGLDCDLDNAVSACAAGRCIIASCRTGYGDCDGLIANGCETWVVEDEFSCGACGTVCASGELCCGSMCTVTTADSCCADFDLGSMVGPAVAMGTTSGTSAYDPCSAGGSGPEILYTWMAPSTGSFTFDTCGSGYDTTLWVADGTCDGASLGCNDDSCGLQSSLSVSLTAGQRVVIGVDGYSASSTGSYVLNITGP